VAVPARPGQGERLWLIAEGKTAEDRSAPLRLLTRWGWRPLEQHEFAQATVVLLGREGDDEPRR
jgi:hypothetical protein